MTIEVDACNARIVAGIAEPADIEPLAALIERYLAKPEEERRARPSKPAAVVDLRSYREDLNHAG